MSRGELEKLGAEEADETEEPRRKQQRPLTMRGKNVVGTKTYLEHPKPLASF